MVWDRETLKSRGLISNGHCLPYNPGLVERARELRKQMTPSEVKLWVNLLRDFRYRVLRQRPIDHFIVDFYCPRMKLVIEIDGANHFSENGGEYDKERETILKSYGLKVIRFSNSEIQSHFEEVCKKIANCSR